MDFDKPDVSNRGLLSIRARKNNHPSVMSRLDVSVYLANTKLLRASSSSSTRHKAGNLGCFAPIAYNVDTCTN